MRRNLKYAVCRGIDNQIARFHVLLAEISDDGRTGVRLIAKHTASGLRFEGGNDFRREAVRIGRHRLLRNQSGNLPMPGRCIFSFGELGAFAERTNRCTDRCPDADAVDVEQSERLHVRYMEFLLCRAGTQRMAACVAELRSVRQLTHAERIQYD